MLESGKMPEDIVKEKGLAQITDTGEIERVVDNVLSENPEAAEGIRAGREKAMAFLVGQVMKKTKGKANPQLVNKILREKIHS
jgi:aspartyl-tRNA(Asn)/glutamyl-tRNA(Gln) amidotransferase subunit B